MIDKNADLAFVRHYNSKHGGAFPLWVMMEMFSFGALVYFYQDLHKNDKKDIALHYYGFDYRLVENWLEKLAGLRNHCAHYNRVYANALPWELRTLELTSPVEYTVGVNSTLFDFFVAMRMLHKRCDWGDSLVVVLETLFAEYSDVVDPSVLGFTVEWHRFFTDKLQSD